MGKWIYNFWKDDQHPRGIYRRATLEELRKPNPAWEVVLDVDDLAKREGKPWVFHGMDCLPPEYTECLVSLSPGGGDAEEIREFDPKSLAFEPQGFSVPSAKTSVAWRDADSVFIGTDFGPGSLTSSGYPRTVRLWKRGTALASAATCSRRSRNRWRGGLPLALRGRRRGLIADNRTFMRLTTTRCLPTAACTDSTCLQPLRSTTCSRDGCLVSLKDDWQHGDRKFARDSVLIADPAALRKTGEGAGKGDIEVLAESTDSEVVLGAVAAGRAASWSPCSTTCGVASTATRRRNRGGPGGRFRCPTTAVWDRLGRCHER
jgi:prolyl oligopeptidase